MYEYICINKYIYIYKYIYVCIRHLTNRSQSRVDACKCLSTEYAFSKEGIHMYLYIDRSLSLSLSASLSIYLSIYLSNQIRHLTNRSQSRVAACKFLRTEYAFSKEGASRIRSCRRRSRASEPASSTRGPMARNRSQARNACNKKNLHRGRDGP